MGWFKTGTDYLRAELQMNFDIQAGEGVGTVRWTPLVAHPLLPRNKMAICLAGLHYGRTLHIHQETRDELFERVGAVARDLVGGADEFRVGRWVVTAGGRLGVEVRDFSLILHLYSDISAWGKPKTYVATVNGDHRGELYLDFKMALGLERVFAPGSLLLHLDALTRTLQPGERMLLGQTLLSINGYYGSPSRIRALPFGERKALGSALPLLYASSTPPTLLELVELPKAPPELRQALLEMHTALVDGGLTNEEIERVFRHPDAGRVAFIAGAIQTLPDTPGNRGAAVRGLIAKLLD